MSKCAYCNKEDELRPYGKNGASICFECAMQDEDETKRQFQAQLDACGGGVIILGEETGPRPHKGRTQ